MQSSNLANANAGNSLKMSLRDRQIAALIEMLNFNHPPSEKDANETIWKVLIYDEKGRDIISPLFKVDVLRDNGVTLHL